MYFDFFGLFLLLLKPVHLHPLFLYFLLVSTAGGEGLPSMWSLEIGDKLLWSEVGVASLSLLVRFVLPMSTKVGVASMRSLEIGDKLLWSEMGVA